MVTDIERKNVIIKVSIYFPTISLVGVSTFSAMRKKNNAVMIHDTIKASGKR
jgi:hypothetical protein